MVTYINLNYLNELISTFLFKENKSKKNKTGQLSATYLIWYGIVRLIIEGMRSDSLMLGPIKIAQLVSLIFIIIGIIIFIKNNKNQIYIDDKININTRRKLCTKK